MEHLEKDKWELARVNGDLQQRLQQTVALAHMQVQNFFDKVIRKQYLLDSYLVVFLATTVEAYFNHLTMVIKAKMKHIKNILNITLVKIYSIQNRIQKFIF